MINALTAVEWFMVAGALMFVFGVGLLALVITGSRRPRRRPAQRPVREITRLRLHEVSLDTRPGPYGPYGAVGFEVVSQRAARPMPAVTRTMPRIPRHDGRNQR